VAVSIYNVIHIFRDLRTHTYTYTKNACTNIGVDEFADARKSAKRERVGRVERVRASRRGTEGKEERENTRRASNEALHTVSYHTDSILSDEFVKHPFYTYARTKEENFVGHENFAKATGVPLMRNANWPRNVIAIGVSRAAGVSRLVI